MLGIDLGLKTFATIAYPDGTIEKVQAREPLKRSLRSLRRSQRKLARRTGWQPEPVQGQGGRGPAAPQDGKYPQGLPAPVVAPDNGQRRQWSRWKPCRIKGWQRLWGRKTSDLAPGELLRQLEYKAQWRGGTFLKVARDFPSSQLCHDCGERKGKLGLEVRRRRCSAMWRLFRTGTPTRP